MVELTEGYHLRIMSEIVKNNECKKFVENLTLLN